MGCSTDPLYTPHAFLRHGKIGLSSGARFGPPGHGFVRLNFAAAPARLVDAVKRMAEARDRVDRQVTGRLDLGS
ncbi:hypothetical protein [Nonomuraea aurantiaca]|uniref:hypothetical protein n=1 Tax=Nonomuraea aurantiaca TaxID=2878562 RepID=UPI001CD97957|nr:hypothetical protein [Nonomuraea aurantiaca]MCA2222486.1 hypothetical protein [Nonomuraea aurantiaca]